MARPPERSPSPDRIGLWAEEVSNALTAGLTVSENLAQCWMPLTLVVGQEYRIQPIPALKGRHVYGLSVERVQVIAGAGVTGPVFVTWEPTLLGTQPALKLLAVYGIANGTKATITLLLKAE